MDKADKITSSDVKRFNKNRIFKVIYYAGRVSRQDIANILDLSLPTIKQNLNVLEKENLIYYEGNFDSTGGRKAQVISVNPKAAFSVCVNLFDKGFNVSLVNLKGELVQAKTYEKHFDDSKQYAECVAKCIDDVISANGVHKDKVLGVGITVPGIFDKTNTIVRTSLTMNLKDYPISNITDYIFYPCLAMNDARSGAYAEFWNEMRIKGRDIINNNFDWSFVPGLEENRMYITLNNWVGGASIGKDNVQKGKNNRFGEVGHMTIHNGGKMCSCGKKGCFESYVSINNLTDDFGISVGEFFERLEKGDKEVKKCFDAYLDNLAIGINNIHILTDNDVVIAGPVSVYLEKYIDVIRKMLTEKCSFGTDGNYFGLAKCDYRLSKAGAALHFIGDFVENV